jgi:exosortase
MVDLANRRRRTRKDFVPLTSRWESPFGSRPHLVFVFVILGAISLVIWWGPLTASFALALRNEQYTHLLLIFPISAVLIFVDWKMPERSSSFSIVLGSVLLVFAVIARWETPLVSSDARLSLNMLALVFWWNASFLLCFGAQAFRRALFPLCLLLWLVPFPDFVLNPIVTLLQRGSAASAHFLFAAVGMPVAQRGMFLHIAGLMLEVAPECSSIRSSLMLIVTTMVLAQMLLRSPWRKAFVITVAIPLSIAKNGLRIFTLGVLATYVDRSFLTGRLHRQGGIIFFAIALAAIIFFLWILRRGEDQNSGLTRDAHLERKSVKASHLAGLPMS